MGGWWFLEGNRADVEQVRVCLKSLRIELGHNKFSSEKSFYFCRPMWSLKGNPSLVMNTEMTSCKSTFSFS